jgi:L-asparaginase
MKVKVLTTGGTIDDLDYASVDEEPKAHKTYVPELFKQARINIDINFEKLMSKDSKFVTDEDRELILKKSKECTEDKIIITHGTETMSKTAEYLGKKDLEKTIILLGAFIPANRNKSDALFNLGSAITAVQILPAGVYVTMNGKIFSWDNVKKNMDTGSFETSKRSYHSIRAS